jgi:hypothetical protein
MYISSQSGLPDFFLVINHNQPFVIIAISRNFIGFIHRSKENAHTELAYCKSMFLICRFIPEAQPYGDGRIIRLADFDPRVNVLT